MKVFSLHSIGMLVASFIASTVANEETDNDKARKLSDPYAPYDPYANPYTNAYAIPQTPRPTPYPTPRPTPLPTPLPTFKPTSHPTYSPTYKPLPTYKPTYAATHMPTEKPTYHPTKKPTKKPTYKPTPPTAAPTPAPTTPAPTPCISIFEYLCKQPGFNTLSTLIFDLRLSPILENVENDFTVFAPNDEAFAKISGVLAKLPDEVIVDVLLFHVTRGILPFDDLTCFESVLMVNDEFSFTDCLKWGTKFQVGPGNSPEHKPKIVTRDIEVCNGIIHEVNNVLIPELTDAPSNAPSSPPSSSPSSAPSMLPSEFPSDMPSISEEPSEGPTLSAEPSERPSLSAEPSSSPTV